MPTMNNTHPENDVRVERQRWGETCDSMVESRNAMLKGGAEFQRQKALTSGSGQMGKTGCHNLGS